MQKTVEEQEVIVRGSAEHKEYMRHKFGYIKGMVSGFEERLAISGRAMLLIYVAYITVKAGVQNSLHVEMPPLLDIFMLAIQVLGLEGSVPGLIHLSEEMESSGKKKDARMVKGSAYTAQTLAVATAVDIVLQSTHVIAGYNIDALTTTYSNLLFVLRVLIIGMYLIAMARLEHKGPKVISAHEAAKQAQDKEQALIRIDNNNILAAVEKGIDTWAKPMIEAMKGSLENQMQQMLVQHADDRAVLKSQIEALQMAGGSALSLAEIARQVDASVGHAMRQVDAKIDASLPNLDALTQHVTRQVLTSLPTSENTSAVDYEKLTRLIAEQIDAKIDVRRSTPPAVRQSAAPKPQQSAPVQPASQPSNITEIGGMGKKAYFAEFEKNPSLLALNPYELAEKFTGNKSMEPTARRAKKDYLDLHPELKSMAV
jgi:hypothetical protein